LLLNHRSHRVRAQLEDEPEWDSLQSEPHSEAAQTVIARLIYADGERARLDLLKESLLREGQQTNGLVTSEGVLINGNTRAVVLREMSDPAKRYIRVAVLPQTASPNQLSLLELRLQMQKELRGPYSFTNELLFIEELHQKMGMPPEQIAQELRIDAKKGKAEITARLQMLDLLRRMRAIPKDSLKLTFFNAIKLEQMREILRVYNARLKEDPAVAELYLASCLVAIDSGVTAVHQLRRVDETFMDDFIFPRLEENAELFGAFTDASAGGIDEPRKARPVGVDRLLGGKDKSSPIGAGVNRLLNIVTQKEKAYEFTSENKKFKIDKEKVKEAVKEAMFDGISTKRIIENTEDKLGAPAATVRKAANELEKVDALLTAVIKSPDYDNSRRNVLRQEFRTLRKRYRAVESLLTIADIIAGDKRQTGNDKP
jgi:hypothetical protein